MPLATTTTTTEPPYRVEAFCDDGLIHPTVLLRISGSNVGTTQYATRGVLTVGDDVECVTLVNATNRDIHLHHLPWACRAYDFAHKCHVQSSRAGDSILLRRHPHAHWKCRVRNFCDLQTESDGTVCHYVGFIDKPPSDESVGAPVDTSALVDDPRKRLVLIQDGRRSMVARVDGFDTYVNFADVAERFLTKADALHAIGPPDVDATLFFNALFGAVKRDVPTDADHEVLVKLPPYVRLDDSVVYEHDGGVRRVTFGDVSKTLWLTLNRHATTTWQVLLVCAKTPRGGDSVGAAADDADEPSDLLTVVRHIVAMHACDSPSRMVQKAFCMFEVRSSLADELARCELLRAMWNRAVGKGVAAWDDARQKSATDQVSPHCLLRRNPSIKHRVHSHVP